MKLGQGENSELFETEKKKKIQKCNIKLGGGGGGRGGGWHPPALLALVKANGLSHESQAFLFSAAASESLRVAREDPLTVREQKTNGQTDWPYDF